MIEQPVIYDVVDREHEETTCMDEGKYIKRKTRALSPRGHCVSIHLFPDCRLSHKSINLCQTLPNFTLNFIP